MADALGQPLLFNKPDPRAFGVLVTAQGLQDAAVARLSPRAREVIVPVGG